MRQYEAVVAAMKDNGGYSTLGQLYRNTLKIPGCEWKTKTPYASIRRIVQDRNEFFKIRPGLWALTSEKERILQELAISESAPKDKVEDFNHSYYQGLLIQLGNVKKFETFVPAQDKNKKFLNQRLADFSTLDNFYNFSYERLLKRARTIDVSWFNERKLPNAFFEVEHSTDIQNSLLKFLEFQDFRIRFFIVADQSRQREFESKINYQAFKPIHQDVEFLNYERLSEWHTKVIAASAIELF